MLSTKELLLRSKVGARPNWSLLLAWTQQRNGRAFVLTSAEVLSLIFLLTNRQINEMAKRVQKYWKKYGNWTNFPVLVKEIETEFNSASGDVKIWKKNLQISVRKVKIRAPKKIHTLAEVTR